MSEQSEETISKNASFRQKKSIFVFLIDNRSRYVSCVAAEENHLKSNELSWLGFKPNP